MGSDMRIPKAELTGMRGAMVNRMPRKMVGDVLESLVVQSAGGSARALFALPSSQAGSRFGLPTSCLAGENAL